MKRGKIYLALNASACLQATVRMNHSSVCGTELHNTLKAFLNSSNYFIPDIFILYSLLSRLTEADGNQFVSNRQRSSLFLCNN